MSRSKEFNNNIENITEIFQKQESLIYLYKLSQTRYERVVKLLLTFDLIKEEKIKLCESFDKCETTESIIELYQKYLKELRDFEEL